MGERPIFLEGANPVLIGAVILLGISAVLLWVGPGIGAVARAHEVVRQKEGRFAAWNEEREAADSLTPRERERWSRDFDRVRHVGVSAPDEASLMSRVARRLSAPTVHGLEVTLDQVPEDEDSEQAPLEIKQPFGAMALEFRRVPLRVRFDASYSDVKMILEGFAPGRSSGMTLERVELQRRFPNVRVELEIAVWTRDEVQS